MSKRRDLRNRSSSFINNASLDQKKLRNSSFFGSQTAKSKYIPEAKQSLSGIEINQGQLKKDRLFNRNISYFRQSFNQNDSTQLPFMSSLRVGQKYKSCEMKNLSTICKPFEAGEKSTSNMKFRKRITDLHGKGIRMTNALYRWHNQSGVNNKQSTIFECTLRDYNQTQDKNPEEQKFFNLIKPIKYQDVQPKHYELNSIICPRQKKIFLVA